MSDDELLTATRGEAEAFGVFYERHVDFVIAFTRRATGDLELALDVTAESFAAALVASRRYVPGGAPARAWLLAIVRHKIADARERGAREASARRRLGMPLREFADAELERVEQLADLDGEYVGELDRLAPEQAAAIRERIIEERDYEEIARTTGTSQATIRKRVSRGLARLARTKESST